MCHMAAGCLSENKNVLYITLEMAEERIAERIDANLMNVTMDTLKEMPKTSYEKKIGKLREKIKGKAVKLDTISLSCIVAYPRKTNASNHIPINSGQGNFLFPSEIFSELLKKKT